MGAGGGVVFICADVCARAGAFLGVVGSSSLSGISSSPLSVAGGGVSNVGVSGKTCELGVIGGVVTKDVGNGMTTLVGGVGSVAAACWSVNVGGCVNVVVVGGVKTMEVGGEGWRDNVTMFEANLMLRSTEMEFFPGQYTRWACVLSESKPTHCASVAHPSSFEP